MNRSTQAVTRNSFVQLEKSAGSSRRLDSDGARTANVLLWFFLSSVLSNSSVLNSFFGGHSHSSSSRNAGPSYQSLLSFMLSKLNPLVGASAGLSVPGTCCHCSLDVSSQISDTL